MTEQDKIEPRQLTHAELLEAAKGDGWVTGIVAVDLDELIDGDLESYIDLLSERLTGCTLLMQVEGQVVGTTPEGSILIQVSGDPSEIVADELRRDDDGEA